MFGLEQIIVLIIFVISTVIIFYGFKLYGLTVFSFFYLGFILFNLLGFLLSSLFYKEVYILSGNINRLNLLFDDIVVVFLIMTILFFCQAPIKRKMIAVHNAFKKYNDGTVDKDVEQQKNQKGHFYYLLYFFALLFCTYIVISISLTDAPLLNIGRFSVEQMHAKRTTLYVGNVSLFLIYLFLYLIFPLTSFLAGKNRHNFTFLLPLAFVSLLTLSKTAITFFLAFYFIGRYLREPNFRVVILGALSIIITFVLVVYSTYMVTIDRSVMDIIEVFFLRLFAIPVSISAGYEEIYTFNMGYRTSNYYTYIFGGEFYRADLNACLQFSGLKCTMVSGFIGNANLNVPTELKYIYYFFICLFVFVSSLLTNKFKNSYNGIFPVLLGLISFMFYLTEFTVVLNSYGFLWLLLVVIFHHFVPLKQKG